MILDIVFALLVIAGFMKGFNDGVIKSVFTLVSYVIGFFAGLRLSLNLSEFMQQSTNIPSKILPFLSFVIIFVLVLLMIKFFVYLIEKILKGVHLNFVNKIAGGLVWCLIVSMVIGSALWLMEKAEIVSEQNLSGSITYPYVREVGSVTVDNTAQVIPFIKNTISELDEFIKASAEHLDQ